MQSTKKYSWITTWPRQTLIPKLPLPREKKVKIVRLSSSYSDLEE